MTLLLLIKKKITSLAADPKLFMAKAERKLVLLMTNPLTHFIFDPLEKRLNPYPKQSNFKEPAKGYSIVMITGGDDLAMLEKALASIDQELSGTPAEIILVGPPRIRLNKALGVPLKFLVYHDLKFLSPFITRKKNLGVSLCQYDKVVLCHDYILFESGWLAGWDKFGDDFDVAINRIKDKDGTRWRDWLVLDYPGLGAGYLPYHAEATPYQYISGTYFVVKRDFYLANPLNEKLRWGDSEDIEWSQRVRAKTIFKFNHDSSVRCAKFKGPMSAWHSNTLALEKIFSEPSPNKENIK